LYSYRLRQRLAVERVRTRLATDLHDDLGAGLVEIAILSEVARQNSAEPAQAEAMEAVAAKARELRSAISDIVWSVDPARDQLTNVVERWRQIANSALGNISLRFSAPPEQETDSITVSFAARRHLILIFKEAVANVARHAGASHVAVTVELERRHLTVSISDDGCGFAPAPDEANGGNGLRNMRSRADEMNGAIDIKTAPGAGTVVKFSVSV
jgi:signal transduction histidine kinase